MHDQCHMFIYRFNLYFYEYKLALIIDEYNHTNINVEEERKIPKKRKLEQGLRINSIFDYLIIN